MQMPGMQMPGMQMPGMQQFPGMQQPGMQQPGMQQPGMMVQLDPLIAQTLNSLFMFNQQACAMGDPMGCNNLQQVQMMAQQFTMIQGACNQGDQNACQVIMMTKQQLMGMQQQGGMQQPFPQGGMQQPFPQGGMQQPFPQGGMQQFPQGQMPFDPTWPMQ
jgi:hypothetical protein